MKRIMTALLVITLIFPVLGMTRINADDVDASGFVNETVEYISPPVQIVKVSFQYLPADLSGLDSFQTDAARLAQVIYGEANGLPIYDKSMVAWCVLNRLDMGLYGDSIGAVLTSPHQFNYKSSFPVLEENYRIAADVLMRHEMEQYLLGDPGRTLPAEFVNFRGNGKENIFKDRQGNTYTRYLRSPYDGE